VKILNHNDIFFPSPVTRRSHPHTRLAQRLISSVDWRKHSAKLPGIVLELLGTPKPSHRERDPWEFQQDDGGLHPKRCGCAPPAPSKPSSELDSEEWTYYCKEEHIHQTTQSEQA